MKIIVIIMVIAFLGVGIFLMWNVVKKDSGIVQIPTQTQTLTDENSDLQVSDSGDGLPPDPGEAGLQTLEGIDSDNDGVRDDIQRSIYQSYPESVKTRAAMTQYAMAFQTKLLEAEVADDEKLITNAKSIQAAYDCLRYVQDSETALSLANALRVGFLNTKDRLLAYDKAIEGLSGKVFKKTPENQRKGQCAFDPDSLEDRVSNYSSDEELVEEEIISRNVLQEHGALYDNDYDDLELVSYIDEDFAFSFDYPEYLAPIVSKEVSRRCDRTVVFYERSIVEKSMSLDPPEKKPDAVAGIVVCVHDTNGEMETIEEFIWKQLYRELLPAFSEVETGELRALEMTDDLDVGYKSVVELRHGIYVEIDSRIDEVLVQTVQQSFSSDF